MIRFEFNKFILKIYSTNGMGHELEEQAWMRRPAGIYCNASGKSAGAVWFRGGYIYNISWDNPGKVTNDWLRVKGNVCKDDKWWYIKLLTWETDEKLATFDKNIGEGLEDKVEIFRIQYWIWPENRVGYMDLEFKGKNMGERPLNCSLTKIFYGL